MRTAEKLYDEDFYAWTQLQARELQRLARTSPNGTVARSNRVSYLDLEHLAEEIRDLGKHERRAVRSLTRRIMEHLLLLAHSPARKPRPGWISEVVTFRRDLRDTLTGTLRRDLHRRLQPLYAEARSDLETRLRARGEATVLGNVPEACPWTLDEIVGDFWPDEP